MNFLKSREPDVAVVSREKRIKEAILSELSAVLKSISSAQLKRPGEPIYTCDSANHLCNVFEAVFLHGLKSIQGINVSTSIKNPQLDSCSFWAFVQRFSHKDTIYQLKRLSNIKTEVGMSRAWVKLAINDGLVESYITTILAQPKVVRQYYTRLALLRDLEHPGILLKLIQVLTNFDFQLVYNLSQLNAWGTKTLALAGFIDRPFLFESEVTTATHSQRSRSSTLDMDDVPGFNRSSSIISAEVPEDDVFNVTNPTEKESKPLENSTVNSMTSKSSSASVHDALCTVGEEKTASLSVTDDNSSQQSSTSRYDNSFLIDSAVQELYRLRTANYSIDDILTQDSRPSDDHEQPVPDLEPDDIMNDPELAADTNKTEVQHKEGSKEGIEYSVVYPESREETDKIIHNQMTSSKSSSGSFESTDGHLENLEPFCPPIKESEPSSAPKADFQVGTPLSDTHPVYQEPDIFDNDFDDQKDDNSYEGEDSLEDDTPYAVATSANADVPLSAAQAIMNKRLSGPEIIRTSNTSANDDRLCSSLGTSKKYQLNHGNSLSSLTGWGLMASNIPSSDALDSESSSLPQVQSFAEIVSEHKQNGEEVLDVTAGVSPVGYNSPIQDYKNTHGSNLPDNKSKILGNTSPQKSLPVDDFVVIGEIDQDNCADILSLYGQLTYEKGLDAQDFKCHSCSAPIGIIYGVPLVCSYTRKYYCPSCHINEDAYIPAKIAYNWDFSKYKVSKSSKDFLVSAESMPLLNIEYINPMLYDHIPELNRCKLLRTQLLYLKRYLFACNPTIADQLKELFWPKEYLYEEIHTYSVQDLLIVNNSNSLLNQIKKGVKFARNHISSCQSCEYRGFLCEICNDPRVIFPFDLDTTSRCSSCSAVYHRACFVIDCPKCERIKHRNALLRNSGDIDDTKSDIYFESI